MRVFKELYDASDLRNWALNNGWCLHYTIKRLEETDNWEPCLFLYRRFRIKRKMQLNDFLRFDIDNILDEYEEEDEEEEDE